MPVSILGLGRGVMVPSSLLSNCMNTRFHNSSQRSQSQPTAQFGIITPELLAPVNVDLGTGAAGACITHGPEIILLAQAGDTFGRNPLLLVPDFKGFVIIFINGYIKFVGIKPVTRW